MDWYVDGGNPEALGALRHDAIDYLSRHATAESDLADVAVVIGELLANVHRHARGPCWVNIDWSGEEAVISVYDLGPGFTRPVGLPEPESLSGRGLFIVDALSDELLVMRREQGGAVVKALLPARRAKPHTPLAAYTKAVGSLPSPHEVDEQGWFGKEPFLRALVVQLAQHVEREAGPTAAEEAVTAVGTGVGARMEEAYRDARQLVDRLTPAEIADLYVGLKRAIDGDFYVVEMDENMIRLRNRRCPFGDAVMHSPHLCRMTSSVFGGIAARNSDNPVLVQLDRRIALGDPECEVTVWLDRKRATHDTGHGYAQT